MKKIHDMSQVTHYRVKINGFLWNDRIDSEGELIPRDSLRPQLDYALGTRQFELFIQEPERSPRLSLSLGSALFRMLNH